MYINLKKSWKQIQLFENPHIPIFKKPVRCNKSTLKNKNRTLSSSDIVVKVATYNCITTAHWTSGTFPIKPHTVMNRWWVMMTSQKLAVCLFCMHSWRRPTSWWVPGRNKSSPSVQLRSDRGTDGRHLPPPFSRTFNPFWILHDDLSTASPIRHRRAISSRCIFFPPPNPRIARWFCRWAHALAPPSNGGTDDSSSLDDRNNTARNRNDKLPSRDWSIIHGGVAVVVIVVCRSFRSRVSCTRDRPSNAYSTARNATASGSQYSRDGRTDVHSPPPRPVVCRRRRPVGDGPSGDRIDTRWGNAYRRWTRQVAQRWELHSIAESTGVGRRNSAIRRPIGTLYTYATRWRMRAGDCSPFSTVDNRKDTDSDRKKLHLFVFIGRSRH